MAQLNIWELRAKDADQSLAERVLAGFERIAARPPKGFTITAQDRFSARGGLYSSEDPTEQGGALTPTGENERVYVIGEEPETPLGYINCVVLPPGDSIGTISPLLNFHGINYSDLDGEPVTSDNLAAQLGYSAYTGAGPVCSIQEFKGFSNHQKVMPTLFDHLQSQGFELIEVDTDNQTNFDILHRSGFKDAGFDDTYNHMVMVWNNPKYEPGTQLQHPGKHSPG